MARADETHAAVSHAVASQLETASGGDSNDRQPNVPPKDTNLAAFGGSFAAAARPTPVNDQPPWFKSREYFLKGWTTTAIWKAAFIEGVATCALVFISGQITATLMNYNTVQLGAYIGTSNIALLTIFIYATAAPTGGHINQLITFSAMFAGICPFPRGVLYICAQTIGSSLAGDILTGIWGRERSIQYKGCGCFYDPSQITNGQIFLIEGVSSFVILYLAYGVGLDPRQAVLFGPRLGPLLVGVALGLVSCSSSGAIPGFAGAQMSPGRCLAFAIARRDFSGQWIWWTAPAVTSLIFTLMYNLCPPNTVGKSKDGTSYVLPVQRGV